MANIQFKILGVNASIKFVTTFKQKALDAFTHCATDSVDTLLYSWSYTSRPGFQFFHVTKEQNGIHVQESKCRSGLAGMKLKVVFCLCVLQPGSWKYVASILNPNFFKYEVCVIFQKGVLTTLPDLLDNTCCIWEDMNPKDVFTCCIDDRGCFQMLYMFEI